MSSEQASDLSHSWCTQTALASISIARSQSGSCQAVELKVVLGAVDVLEVQHVVLMVP